MAHMSPHMTLKNFIMRQTAGSERHPSQVQIASSTSPTMGPHERLGNAFRSGVLFDSSSGLAMCNCPHSATGEPPSRQKQT